MAEDKLYLSDPNRSEFTATVIASSKDGVVLDRTYFYPSGGHQESDCGTLTTATGASFAVVKVKVRHGAIIHELDAKTPPEVGVDLVARIDWPRRRYLSQLHSAQHLISRLVHSLTKFETVNTEIAGAGGAVTFSREIEPSLLPTIEAQANAVIARDMPVTREIANGIITVVVGDPASPFDRNRCAGTHVTHTGEMEHFFILGLRKATIFFDVGEPGWTKARAMAREHFRMAELLESPANVFDGFTQVINDRNRLQEECAILRETTITQSLRHPPVLHDVCGLRVGLVRGVPIHVKTLRRILSAKEAEIGTDVLLIVNAENVYVLSFTPGRNALTILRRLATSTPGFRGGGGQDFATGTHAGDVDTVIAELLKACESNDS